MQLIELSINQQGNFQISINSWFVAGTICLCIIVVLCKRGINNLLMPSYEIDETEIGIGNSKIKIKPNIKDLQIAYQLWVELKTRKLGITIDENKDVIHEVYNSWYEFFGITRELIKGIPAQKVRSCPSTRELVSLSMRILNEAIRPHLTTWQAKYRHWYDNTATENKHLAPQEIQKTFPAYSELIKDLKRVNGILVGYSQVLERMVDEKLR